MEFKKNKRYYSCLKKEGTIGDQFKFVDTNPLFICGDKGLFPVYRTGGRQGVLNKNYHELILKNISKELKAKLEHKVDYNKINQNTKNVLEFGEKEEDEFGGL